MIKVSTGFPTFDGTDYPYWKNKMRMHLEAIDNDLWYVVENGVPSVTPSLNIPEIVISYLKMHSHLILPVGVVRPIEGRTPSRDLDHTCGRHN